MNQQETTSEWLARKKAALSRLQGSYRVPGTSLDKVAINRPAEDQVTNEIIFMPIGVVIKALFSEIVDQRMRFPARGPMRNVAEDGTGQKRRCLDLCPSSATLFFPKLRHSIGARHRFRRLGSFCKQRFSLSLIM